MDGETTSCGTTAVDEDGKMRFGVGKWGGETERLIESLANGQDGDAEGAGYFVGEEVWDLSISSKWMMCVDRDEMYFHAEAVFHDAVFG